MRRGDRGVGSFAQLETFDVTTGENVIVIHPGSRWLRIGRASDAVPREIPHIIARRLRVRPSPATVDPNHSGPKESSAVEETLTMLRTTLKQHQRLSKRKVAPNAYSQVLTYNRRATPEVIQDHNDPFRIEWLLSSEIKEDPVVGEEALRIADPNDFIIRYPIRNGCFNVEDYASIEEVLGDIEAIWSHAIEVELKINRRDLSSFGVVLAIPDIYNRLEVILLAEVLLRRMGFQQLLVQQSSALVTFGAGFSSACVVDVGAQKTSVCCVEDGYCAQESRVTTMYGGDDITRFLFNLFMRSRFPYREASLQRMHDWNMVNDLRERFCTVNLSDVNIRLHNFFVRLPDQHTRKYSFKTYDEGYQAPLCLFYPAIIDAYYQPPDYSRSFLNAYYPTSYATPATLNNTVYVSDPQAQYSRIPLDAAITHSIVHAGSIDRAKKLYTSIVVVGGGVSFIPGFNELLSSRLMYMRPEFLQSVERVDIVSAPRDLDPRVLAWKGGAVLSRLECAKEMWLSSKDWADFGPKLLRDRVLFQW
ncbi:actin-like ATPase domain-containing protein [Coemansia reversa NRRL 1564]|uniref:Actin-like ATPase domain-containing protein n=1 Tax=Coemansia reversa (strain ATCC 12441 / NRRL 1564) TaxID=763665 RepID=A0A2G5BAB3_COERN|nr:actin-like ATPase domain-containing protein [Coemansia reversa NRRL 1564]|eukprot:PIA15944.1 actin-like ATPase domain-containing protein [Coemansia reversa NRRL 1564]